MVKKRNHYIPQFFLRRFASRVGRTSSFLWQFRSDKTVAEIATRDAAVTTLFYGDPKVGLEEALADVESKQAALLVDIDNGMDPTCRQDDIWQLARCLGYRTRALRTQFVDTTRALVTRMSAVSNDSIANALWRALEVNYESYLAYYLNKLGPEMQAQIEQVLNSPAVYELIRRYVMMSAQGAAPMLTSLLTQIISSGVIESAAERGHIQGLARLTNTDNVAASYAGELQWVLKEYAAETVVLGDGVVVAVGPGEKIGAMGKFGRELVALYVPIAPSRVLVARQRGDARLLGVSELNEASVQLSYDTFFASRNSEEELRLVAQIGAGEPILTGDDVEDLANNAWNSLGEKPPNTQ